MRRSPITTHVLDTTRGRPANGVSIVLSYQDQTGSWHVLSRGNTDEDGRITDLLPGETSLKEGIYQLTFEVEDYFRQLDIDTFYPVISIVFKMADPDQHFHVPLLLSPFGYTTYRGS